MFGAQRDRHVEPVQPDPRTAIVVDDRDSGADWRLQASNWHRSANCGSWLRRCNPHMNAVEKRQSRVVGDLPPRAPRPV